MQAFVGPLGAISGFLVWTVFSLRPGGGIREAWDGTPYWTIGLPLLFLLHAAFGAAQRRTAWRAPLWTVAGHFLAVILVSRAGTGFWLVAARGAVHRPADVRRCWVWQDCSDRRSPLCCGGSTDLDRGGMTATCRSMVALLDARLPVYCEGAWSHGCSKKKDLAIAARHAAQPPGVADRGAGGLPELRRTEAPAPRVQPLRPLRRPRSGGCRQEKPEGHGSRLTRTGPAPHRAMPPCQTPMQLPARP